MSKDQRTIDPKHLEILNRIPAAPVCGHWPHAGLEAALAAAEQRAERAEQRERELVAALKWIRDGLDQMYTMTNEHGLRHLPPSLAPHAGLISGLHKTANIALARAGGDATDGEGE